MIAMSVERRAILGHKFISNIGEILNSFVWAKTEGFRFIGELDRFKVSVYNKCVTRRVVLNEWFQMCSFVNEIYWLCGDEL